MKLAHFLLTAVLAAAVSCTEKAGISSSEFGTLSTGETATLFHLTNTQGASMDVTDYGARVVRIVMPDRNGHLEDVVVGPGTLEAFETGDRFFAK